MSNKNRQNGQSENKLQDCNNSSRKQSKNVKGVTDCGSKSGKADSSQQIEE